MSKSELKRRVHQFAPLPTMADSVNVSAEIWNELVQSRAELAKIAKELGLALDEEGNHQGTHYINKQGVIQPKGSFIDLVFRARKLSGG